MGDLNHIAQTIALTMGVAWASGINLYASIFMLGIMGAAGSLALPPDLQILANPVIIGAAGIMYFVEFFADKIPGLDTAWDGLHTFIRIPAGAAMAAGAAGSVDPAVMIAAAILGGGISAGSHLTKAGTRVLINTSPEPFTNWAASIGEDVMVIGGLYTALNHPVIFIILLILFLIFIAWLLPKIWRGIKSVFAAIGRFFGRKTAPTGPPPQQTIPPQQPGPPQPPQSPAEPV